MRIKERFRDVKSRAGPLGRAVNRSKSTSRCGGRSRSGSAPPEVQRRGLAYQDILALIYQDSRDADLEGADWVSSKAR